MGKRAAFQSVPGVLLAILFLILPSAVCAEEAATPAPAALPAQVSPDMPSTAAPPSASEVPPTAPSGAAPAAAPEAPPSTPSEAAPSDAAPPSTPSEAAPSDAAPAAVPKAASAGEAGTTRASEFPNGLIHTVVQGDTLWDLSAKYLGSPWRWTELWERNRFLTNPHYIYPGIRVVIFPPPPKAYEMAGKEPGPEAEAAPAVAPPPAAAEEPSPQVAVVAPAARILRITEADYVRAGEFFEKRPRGIGRIAGGTEVRVVFSDGEKVILALKKDIPAGQLLGVYRIRGPVRGPAGRRVSGYVKHIVGLIQVQGQENGAVVGIIRKSFEELTRSDIITEEIPAYAPVVIDPGNEGLEASVITGRMENEEFGEGDFVFLDRGSDDGIARGNVFRLFRQASDSKYRVEVAKTVAVRVLPKFTTVYVVNSRQSFEAGVAASRGEPPAR